MYAPRKYRFTLQESVDICVKMLKDAKAAKVQDPIEIEYWAERIRKLQNVANMKGLKVYVSVPLPEVRAQ